MRIVDKHLRGEYDEREPRDQRLERTPCARSPARGVHSENCIAHLASRTLASRGNHSRELSRLASALGQLSYRSRACAEGRPSDAGVRAMREPYKPHTIGHTASESALDAIPLATRTDRTSIAPSPRLRRRLGCEDTVPRSVWTRAAFPSRVRLRGVPDPEAVRQG